jgi:hypothetical protein
MAGNGDWDTDTNWFGPDDGEAARAHWRRRCVHLRGRYHDHAQPQHRRGAQPDLAGHDRLVALSGGSLTVGTTVEVDNSFSLSGGTLANATVLRDTTITGTAPGGTLSGVTLNGTLEVSSGNVTLGGNWSSSGALTAASGSTLNLGGTFNTASVASLSAAGATVNLTGTLNNGSTLSLNDTTGPWNLLGGTISGGTVTTAGAADLVGTTSGCTLSGVTLDGNLDVSNGRVYVSNGLVLNGTALLGNSIGSTAGSVQFLDMQALGGTGTIVFGGGNMNLLVPSVVGAGITIRGQNGTVGDDVLPFTNQGTIRADVPGGSFNFRGTNWVNAGTIQAMNGAAMHFNGSWTNNADSTIQSTGTSVLTLGTTWVNNGTILATGATWLFLWGAWTNNGRIEFDGAPDRSSAIGVGDDPFLGTRLWTNPGQIVVNPGQSTTLYLGGKFHTSDFDNIQFLGCSLQLQGIWDNTGQIVNFDSQTGSLTVNQGTPTGGAWNFAPGTNLLFLGHLNGMDGITVNGDIVLNTGGLPVIVTDNLIINGAVTMEDSSSANALSFSGTQTLGGMADIELGSNGRNYLSVPVVQGAVSDLTIARGVLVHGQNGSIRAATGCSIVNQGTMAADVAGGTLTVQGTWTNQGIVKASNGGTLAAQTAPTNYANGTLTGGTWQVFNNSTLQIPMDSGLITNQATILLDGPNANLFQDSAGTDALANFATNADGASFTITHGRNLTLAGNFTNAGSLTVGPGSTFTDVGAFTEQPPDDALTIQATGTVDLLGTFTNYNGGTLSGGHYLIGGTVQFPGSGITVNYAHLTLDSAGRGSSILSATTNCCICWRMASMPRS